MKKFGFLGLVALLGVAGTATAMDMSKDMSDMKDMPHCHMMKHGKMMKSSSEVVNAYRASDMKMHAAMARVKLTDNADADFLAGMIPHHEGAIGMAEVELKYGKNEKVRQLAQDILSAQKTQVAQMQAMLDEMQK